MRIRNFNLAVFSAATVLLAAAPVFSQSDFDSGQGKAVVTVLPTQQTAEAPSISASQLALKVNGKPVNIAAWKALAGNNAPVQLVVMIDDAARGSIGTQLKDIAQFIQSLPPSAEAGVAYMDNGRAALAGPLSSDHAAVARELRVPNGAPGISGSPYFCLSDLAHHWPSQDRDARRVVVMVTDGVDNYEVRYNPDDPYLQAAIHDAVRSRISVYSIYWRNRGVLDHTLYAANDGQNLLSELTEATGGYSYWQGFGEPVSFQPYFKDLNRRLSHQYEMAFTAPLPHGPGVANLSLHINGVAGKVVAPQKVYVGHPAHAGAAGGE